MSDAPQPPAGWYPNGRGEQQWWDGEKWGRLTSPMPFSAAEGSPYVDSSVVPPAYYPPAMPRPSAPYAALAPRPVKEAGIAYILALLLGGIAAHRFYLGSIGGAIGYIVLLWLGVLLIPIGVGLFMVAAAGLWWFIDLFLIPGMTRDANSLPGRR